MFFIRVFAPIDADSRLARASGIAYMPASTGDSRVGQFTATGAQCRGSWNAGASRTEIGQDPPAAIACAVQYFQRSLRNRPERTLGSNQVDLGGMTRLASATAMSCWIDTG